MKKALITIIIIGFVLLVAGKLIMTFTEGNNNEIALNNEILSSDKSNGSLVSNSDLNIINEEFDNVENITMRLGVYSVVVQGDDTIKNVQLTAKKPVLMDNGIDINKLEISNKNGELTITQKNEKNKAGINLFNNKNYKGELIIKIPTNKQLDSIDIENGVGSIEINNLSLNKLDIDSGTSSVVGNNLSMTSCYIASGTGSVKLYEILTDKLEIDNGTGSVYLSGDIMKDADITTGTSKVELALNSKETEYNYEIETGVGSININNNKYKKEAEINNKSNKNIEISTGTGSINIKTK